MENCNVKKAEGKLGVLVVGLGAVSSTFMTGVLMARKGLAKPVGSMTQFSKKSFPSNRVENFLSITLTVKTPLSCSKIKSPFD